MARDDQERDAGRRAVSTMEEDIKNGSFRRAYLFYGDEGYLRVSYRNRLMSKISGQDTMNVRVFDGKGTDAKAVVDAAGNLPFFSDYLLIVVKDSGLFKKSPDELVDFIGRIPETTVMVFDEETVDKRSRLYKKIAASGLVIPCPRQSEQNLRNWIGSGFAQMGKKISRRALEYFAEGAGDDMFFIRQEMEKLAAFTGDRNTIEEADVAAVASVRVQDRIFDMIDSVASGEKEKAMRIYSDLLELREPPMVIIYMLARHFLLLSNVKEMSDAGMPAAHIASACKVQEWMVNRKYLPQSRRFERQGLREDLRLVAETEQAIKSGELSDKVAVEPLLLRLAGVR